MSNAIKYKTKLFRKYCHYRATKTKHFVYHWPDKILRLKELSYIIFASTLFSTTFTSAATGKITRSPCTFLLPCCFAKMYKNIYSLLHTLSMFTKWWITVYYLGDITLSLYIYVKPPYLHRVPEKTLKYLCAIFESTDTYARKLTFWRVYLTAVSSLVSELIYMHNVSGLFLLLNLLKIGGTKYPM